MITAPITGSSSLERFTPAARALSALAVLWIVIFGVLVVLRHERFGSFGFDLGIYDQGLWLISLGEGQFVTVRGLELFGHHLNAALWLLVPFYWLGAGPHFLNLFQVVMLGTGSAMVYVLARDRDLGDWLAAGLGTAYLLHPTTQLLSWELFHPDAMAVTPLLGAYLAADRRRWGWYAALLTLAVAWKEDVALAAAALGLLLIIRGHRRIGASTIVLALSWFVVATRVIIPAINGMGPFYDHMFGELGASPLEIAGTLVSQPGLLIERLAGWDRLSYLGQLLAPFGLLPLLGPQGLLLGLPQLFINLIVEFPYVRLFRYHYSALPLAALTVALVEGVGGLDRRRRAATILVMLAALATSVIWGPSPIGLPYHRGVIWPPPNPEAPAIRELLTLVPDQTDVSASYDLVPHLSQRVRIYEFPNPWIPLNWGIEGERTHDPEVVDVLAITRSNLGNRAEEEELLHELLGDEFEVIGEAGGVVVAQRRP